MDALEKLIIRNVYNDSNNYVAVSLPELLIGYALGGAADIGLISAQDKVNNKHQSRLNQWSSGYERDVEIIKQVKEMKDKYKQYYKNNMVIHSFISKKTTISNNDWVSSGNYWWLFHECVSFCHNFHLSCPFLLDK